MIYKRSCQIGNYLAGHVPPNRKLFGGTVPPNRKLFGRTVPPNSLPLKKMSNFKIFHIQGANKWYYFLSKPATRPPDYIDVLLERKAQNV